MKFFNIDRHISVIEDLRGTFEYLGCKIDDQTLSTSAHIMGKTLCKTDVISRENMADIITKRLWEPFREAYKDRLADYNGFISCYPPVHAMLYWFFEKPMILNIPIRYEHPFSNDSISWSVFNQFLQVAQVIPTANSIYDQKYFEHFTGRECRYAPSLCAYTKAKYTGKRGIALLYSRCSKLDYEHIVNLIPKELEYPNGYEWQNIADCKCVVHFPYQVSTMSMFEHYTMCIPMFVPTKRYMMELYEQGHEVLREVSWNQIKGLPSKSAIPGKSEQPDPNDYENMGAVQHWLQYADYYSDWMRHVIQFDSMEDLAGLLETTNFQKVSNSMMLHNVERMSFSLNAWNEILKEIK